MLTYRHFHLPVNSRIKAQNKPMPIYEYKAFNVKGKSVTDIIDAESAASARQKLRSARIYPVSIREVYDTASKKQKRLSDFLRSFSSRVSPAELAMITRQLATLLGAGFPLVSALYTLIPQSRSSALKQVLSQIRDSIEEGSSFAGALSQYPDIFSDIYVNMVQSGESSGTLEVVLNRLADISERQQALSHKIKSAMAYPILMSFVGTAILVFLLTYIVPTITAMFEDMDQVLPLPTVILIAVSEYLKTYWWVFLGAAVVILIAFKRFVKTEKGAYWYDRMVLSLPLVGSLRRKLAVGRFTRTLGSLLENGVSLMAALGIVKNIVGNRLFADAIESAAANVEKGGNLSDALGESNLFPNICIQMTQVGENSGELETMLGKVADIYEKEVENTISAMTSMLEPLIILFMAVIIGFIVLAITLPIFEMNMMVG